MNSPLLIVEFAGLMGLFEKRRFRNFLIYVMEFDDNEPKTWKDIDPRKTTMQELYDKYGLDKNTADFTGHALALHTTDEYVELVQFCDCAEDVLIQSFWKVNSRQC